MELGDSEADLEALSQRVGQYLESRALKLATAESCTGGWIAKLVTDVAGSSNWFDRGFVTYSNEAKAAMLGVRPETLEIHGAVSEEVVREMAVGALRRSDAHISVAVSGIAGPGGGSAQKPVGTVWFAWATETAVVVRVAHLPGDREAVRRGSVILALKGVLEATRHD